MKKKLVLTLFVLFGLCCFAAFKNDDDPFSVLIKKLEAYNQDNPQEKVHLHLDKPYYAIGDDIWFKAYIINATTSQPSEISNILYVELINEADSVKKQIKLPVIGGFTWGDFKLTDSLPEGNYRIRAYTQWMRNAGPEFFFDKTLKIGNSWANKVFTRTKYSFSAEKNAEKVNTQLTFTDKTGKAYSGNEVNYVVQIDNKNISKGKALTNSNGEISFDFLNNKPELKSSGKITATIELPGKKKVVKLIPITATSNAIDVQFFPEGGNLVENIPSKLGIKAINSAGLGKDISGSIVDNEGTEITKFNTTHLGMGNVILNPQPGKTYTAIVKFEDGSDQKIKLPQALPEGYVLSVNNMDTSKISVKIYLSSNVLGKGELKLLAQNNGNVFSVFTTKTEKQLVIINIPKKDLPIGILQLTLFGPDNKPVCERLTFVQNQTDLTNLQVQSDRKTYNKRDSVQLTLTSTTDNKPVQGIFSMSVTNTSVVQPDEDNESNIFTTFLLTSDLAGYVEKPNYYFLHKEPAAQSDLDNLLLTQGWRRFSWKTFPGSTNPSVTYKAEKSLAISGTLTTLGGKPIEKGKVSLFSSSGGLFMIDTLTDANGRFNFDKLLFSDSTKFVVQGRNAKNKKNVEIKLDLVPRQVVTKNKNTGDIEVNINEAISSYIAKSENYFDELTKRGLLQRTIMLNEVNIVEKKNKAPNSANLNGAGHADAIITADQLGTCTTLSQCLQGRVAGLMIRDGKAYLMRNGNTPMRIVLDGMNMDADFLDNIVPQEVETIEVLKSIGNTAIYGMNGGGGILVITTKRGGGNYGSVYTPGIMVYTQKGYYTPRQFYSPRYTPESSSQPDLRTTVYWNPQIITSTSGTAKVGYFNTDQSGIYRVVTEGMNRVGQLARTVYTYEVK